MKDRSANSAKQKRPYFPPKLAEVSPEQAEEFLKDRTNCSDSEAKNIVESLRSGGWGQQYRKAS
jgi:hypothetical protein